MGGREPPGDVRPPYLQHLALEGSEGANTVHLCARVFERETHLHVEVDSCPKPVSYQGRQNRDLILFDKLQSP